MSEPLIDASKPLPAWPPSRRQPQLRVYQPSAERLRLDFSGDVDQWSEPLLAAAEMAAGSIRRVEVLIGLGDVSELYEIALGTFSGIREQAIRGGGSMRFIRVSEAALRTFDLHRFEY